MGGGDGVAAKTPAGQVQAGAGDAPTRTRFLRQFELVEKMRAYDPSLDENLINRAYIYATAKHGCQKRHSGDPYFATTKSRASSPTQNGADHRCGIVA
jgi:(p)ppGpp synthase/HD superfamily hydrolase